MSDGIKWGLLAAAIIAIIAIIVSLPLGQAINISELSSALSGIVSITGSFLLKARNLINNFLTPVGRTILTGIIGYICFKWIYTNGTRERKTRFKISKTLYVNG